MKVSAKVENSMGQHQVTISTDNHAHSLVIPPKPAGSGSSVNGGELLLLALATCYCNDIYREAALRGIEVENVEVQVEGEFTAVGEPASMVMYQAKVSARASEPQIRELMIHTDHVAEIHNTLRLGIPVTLSSLEIVPV